MTILEAARFMSFPIPTLCHQDGLSPYGACRLCVVEIGEEPKTKLVSSCTYPVEEGLRVRTASHRVMNARRMILELLLGSCPQSKTIQDLASVYGIRQQRFKQEYENCILCGLCVRMCEEQMMAKAIGFRSRGEKRSIGTPFDIQAMRSLYLCLPGLSASLHLYRTRKADLWRLCQSFASLSRKRRVRRHDVLYDALYGL